jgi:flagellar L-ring protein precursor FlgH
MSHTPSRAYIVVSISLCCILTAGCGPKAVQNSAVNSLQAYVSEAKARPNSESESEGSLWVSHGSRSDMFRDFRAREINDIITIRVVETTQAVATADLKSNKSADATLGFDNLFGVEKHVAELPNMVGGKSSSNFEGKGSTTRATTLQTTLSARVIDVLPNGYLVVEGAREIRLNNETQTVYLTGIVRPEDVSRGNVVASSAVAQMTVRVQGRGAVSQPIRPGWLFKILSGIMPF